MVCYSRLGRSRPFSRSSRPETLSRCPRSEAVDAKLLIRERRVIPGEINPIEVELQYTSSDAKLLIRERVTASYLPPADKSWLEDDFYNHVFAEDKFGGRIRSGDK